MMLFLSDNEFDSLETHSRNIFIQAVYTISPLGSSFGMLRFITIFKDSFNQLQRLKLELLIDYTEHSD